MAIPLRMPPKARLTRRGGWCPEDGTLLTFNPEAPHEHGCPRCRQSFRGEEHDRWWAMGWQLWLAERVVHAAILFSLRGDETHASWALGTLDTLSDSYLEYPNSDNVLGPSRPFFSTYLESLWLLQMCIAVDALESAGRTTAGLDRVRERLLRPSSDLIASYDEGGSNRQVWNCAALLAAGLLLGDHDRVTLAVEGPHGLLHHLSHGLLPDGSWFEGENYHQFAQRGLWYGIALYEGAGGAIPSDLEARWRKSAATPFLTALPDFTMPARRDSQWNVSLRQWRFAEVAELGLARQPDDRVLSGALGTLYGDVARVGDTGRRRSTGEAERNEPACALTRADLGWRSLLFALARPSITTARPVGSVLLPEQGYAVLRADQDRTYVALEYGHGGGGHGHPDRLNLVLQRGDARWLEDPGTGSYTDPSLHWYRSSLAHCAPLPAGRTQLRVPGRLESFDHDGTAAWTRARVDGLAPGVSMARTLIVMPNYLVDELSWSGGALPFLDLPLHADLELEGDVDWTPADPRPQGEMDAGYEFLRGAERGSIVADSMVLRARMEAELLTAFVVDAQGLEVWRAYAPGPPGEGQRRMLFLRAPWVVGRIITVLCWGDGARAAGVEPGSGSPRELTVRFGDGTSHVHVPGAGAWQIQEVDANGGSGTSWTLGAGMGSGLGSGSGILHDNPISGGSIDTTAPLPLPRLHSIDSFTGGALHFALGEAHWRGSEQSWHEAASPSARVSVGVVGESLVVQVDVAKRDPVFAPRRETNELDNEHPDINSDGVQLHISGPTGSDPHMVWILVPEQGEVRCTPRTADAALVAPDTRYSLSADGWSLRATLPLAAVVDKRGTSFRMDVLVNEMPPDRERRRGQLVLSGARGERVWIRGDRQDPAKFLSFSVNG